MLRVLKKIFLTLALIASFSSLTLTAGADTEPEGGGEEKGTFLPVIMYHAVTENQGKLGRDFISPELFESDMKYLKDKGYTTVSAAEILDYVDNGAPLPEKPVLVTFDDGFYSVQYYLLPIMERLGIKAVMNVEGSFAEHASSTPGDQDNPKWSYLTWQEICDLQSSGLFEIGNHSYDMHHARGSRIGCKIRPGEGCEEYREALIQDVGKLQAKLLETCGAAPVVFAYPFGSISKESYGILEEMGLRILLTCYGMPNYLRVDPGETLILNRYNRSGSMSTEKFMSRLLKEE